MSLSLIASEQNVLALSPGEMGDLIRIIKGHLDDTDVVRVGLAAVANVNLLLANTKLFIRAG